jgi:hypothetical protein
MEDKKNCGNCKYHIESFNLRYLKRVYCCNNFRSVNNTVKTDYNESCREFVKKRKRK